MHPTIRPFAQNDRDDLVQLTVAAFEPIFASFAGILGPKIYPIIYPDWRRGQTEAVDGLIANDKMHVLVAEVDGKVVGLVAYEFTDSQTAEVQFLVVHPEHQNRGIGTALNDAALQAMKAGGARLAVVGTGGDVSHAPARRSYEKAGYTALPLVRYYQALE